MTHNCTLTIFLDWLWLCHSCFVFTVDLWSLFLLSIRWLIAAHQNWLIYKMNHFSFLRFHQLSGKSFPLCMRHLHKALRENHHLRHGGRMQYGLFLKGIGLTLEQALQFWRSEFVKGKVDADKVTLQLELILLHIVLVFHRLTLVQYFCVCSSSLFLYFWFCWCHSLLHPSITLERVTQMNERRY